MGGKLQNTIRRIAKNTKNRLLTHPALNMIGKSQG